MLRLRPYRFHHALDSALGSALRGVELHTAKGLHRELDELLRSAGGARPQRVAAAQDLTPRQALERLVRALSSPDLAAVVRDSAASPSRAPAQGLAAAGGAKSPAAAKGSEATDASASGIPEVFADEQAALEKAVADACRKNHDDESLALSKDARALAVATPEQKAQMIRRLKERDNSDEGDRAMLDILESCGTEEEFDRILDASGGKNTLQELDDDDAKHKMNMLVGMWGRTDCATDMAWAKKAEDALLNGGDGLDAPGSDPAEVDLHFGREVIGADDLDGVGGRSLDENLYRKMDPGTHAELIMENAQRAERGRPPLDLNALTAGLRSIIEDPYLSKAERQETIEDLRKENELGKDTMRALGTRRCADAERQARGDLGSYVSVLLQRLTQSHQQAAARYGSDSLRTQALAEEITRVEAAARDEIRDLQRIEAELREPYVVPPGFWDSFDSFVSDVGSMLGTALDCGARGSVPSCPEGSSSLSALDSLPEQEVSQARGRWLERAPSA
jgi:hypothetical protein